MTALTVRLPDDKYQRLKEMSKRRHTSIDHLIDEMATLMLAEHDAETRFLLRAARGQGKMERAREGERPVDQATFPLGANRAAPPART